MTAPVPNPSLLDQLARWVPHTMGCFAHRTDDVGMDYRCICFHDGLVDRLAPKLEAHIETVVEARVQAAAKGHGPRECVPVEDANRVLADARRGAEHFAALASPAPAPDAEEGQ